MWEHIKYGILVSTLHHIYFYILTEQYIAKLCALVLDQVVVKATLSTLTLSSTMGAAAGAPPLTTRPCVLRPSRFHC